MRMLRFLYCFYFINQPRKIGLDKRQLGFWYPVAFDIGWQMFMMWVCAL